MRWLVVAALVAGCAPSLEPIEKLDDDVAAARGKRRVVALVSPS